jgi:hypothetical protein
MDDNTTNTIDYDKILLCDSSSNNIEFNMVNSDISLISQTIGFSLFPYEGMGIVLPVF